MKIKTILLVIITTWVIGVLQLNAQKVVTEEEYRVLKDSVVSLLKIVEKDTAAYKGKPFSDLVKHFEQCGVKITSLLITNYDGDRTFPQHVYGVSLSFFAEEIETWALSGLRTPRVYVYFEESKPYEKAFSLFNPNYDGTITRFGGDFTEEIEAFYSDAIVKSIRFTSMDSKIYGSTITHRLPSSNDREKARPE